AGRERLRAMEEVMDFRGFDRLPLKRMVGSSKGMRRGLGWGRRRFHNPSVLILDEPAAGLDPRARIELREMIERLAADGKAILISSHILTELAEMCDTVGIIEQGKILAVGSVEEIHRRGSNRQQSWVRLRVLGGADGASQWLTARGDVHEMKLD